MQPTVKSSLRDDGNIMIVDDHPANLKLLDDMLRQHGYEVRSFPRGRLALAAADQEPPDLILLDINMPEMNGYEVCELLKASARLADIPVIFLSALNAVEDKVKGFRSGGVDYISKPFDTRELLLRIQALFRRIAQQNGEPAAKTLQIGQVLVDVEKHKLTVKHHEVELTATEFRLLKLLMERKGRVQSRENLLVNVWNYEADIETRTVDTHIRRLREKLGTEAGLIETVRGVGYRVMDS